MAKLIVLAFALFVFGSVVGQDENVLPLEDEPADPTTIPPVDTTTPEPTTKPAPPTTQAPTTTTTTLAPNTTTSPPTPPPTPTPTPPPTPTPGPVEDYKYNVTEDNVTCIMIEGTINFVVNYSIGDNKTQSVTLTLPKHPTAGYNVSGTCNGTEGQQEIEVTWGSEDQTSAIDLEFGTKDGSWFVKSFSASLYIDKDVFPNATDVGKTLNLRIDYGFAPLSVPINSSFNCHSSLAAVNVTGTIDGDDYPLPLASNMEGIQIQAYNKVPNEPDFVTSVHCLADHTSDVVPIAVGCALAALVVIVLIAYLVGRRRRSAAYQSV